MARTTLHEHHEHAMPAATSTAPGGAPALIRWGAVFGGMVIGLSLLLLLVALWVALAFGTGTQAVEDNLAWYVGISAIVAMFVGGLTAGWLSGVPGIGPGFFNGLTVWGLILIVSVAIGAPGAGFMGAQLETVTLQQLNAELAALQGEPLWAGFISLLIGAVVAALGGMIGGMITRPAFGYQLGAVHDERIHPAEEEPRRIVDRGRGTEPSSTIPPHEHRDGQTVDIRGEQVRSGTTAEGDSRG